MKKGSAAAVKKRAKPELQDIDKAVPLAEFLERPDIRAMDHGNKSEAFLRRECEFRGILPSSNRALMEQRLQLFYAGERVTTPELRKQVRLTTNMIVTTGDQHHQLAPVYARGEMTLLGLPHEVIRRCLLPHLTNVDDLFAMLYVCKYVHDDVLDALRERARHEFGVPMAFGANVMALSAFRYWSRVFLQQYNAETQMWRDLENRPSQKAILVHKVLNQLGRYMLGAGFSQLIQNHYPTALERAIDEIRAAIFKTITDHGSIEGLVRERQRQRDLQRCKHAETKALLQDAPARTHAALAVLAEFGCPPFFTYTADNGFDYRLLAKVVWQLVPSGTQHQFLKSFRPHICRGNPKQLRSLASVGDKLPPTVTRILTWASTRMHNLGKLGIRDYAMPLLKSMFIDTGLRLCNTALSDAQLAIQLDAFLASDFRYRMAHYGNVAIWGTDLERSPTIDCVENMYNIRTTADIWNRYHLGRFSSVRVTCVHTNPLDSRVHTYEAKDGLAAFQNMAINGCRWIAIELLNNTHYIPL